MCSSTSFIMQIANICIEVSGFNDEESAGLQDLKRLFRYHEVNRDATAVHHVVVCEYNQFEITHEANLHWVLACIGGTRQKHRRHRFLRKKEVPRYSGTGDVRCYKDSLRQTEYFVPDNAEWRIKHIGEEHITYVYFDRCDEKSSLIPLLTHVIGSQYGCYLLFASSVALDGEALLFAGNSGVGKTPLCMELMKQGATYVGDDLVLVYTDEGQAMVGSLLLPIRCYPNGISLRKKTIDVVSQIAQKPHLNAPLKSIYFLQNAENAKSESCVKPMPSEIMFEKMLGLTNKVNTNADGRHFFNTISSICDSVPCYCLTYSNRNKLNTLFFANNDQR